MAAMFGLTKLPVIDCYQARLEPAGIGRRERRYLGSRVTDSSVLATHRPDVSEDLGARTMLWGVRIK